MRDVFEYRSILSALFDEMDKGCKAFFSQWDGADNLHVRANALRKIYKLIFQNLFVHFAAHIKRFAEEFRNDGDAGDFFPLEHLRHHQLSFLGSQTGNLSVVSFRGCLSPHQCIELINTCDLLKAECVVLPSEKLKLLSDLLTAIECVQTVESEEQVLNIAIAFYRAVGWRRNAAIVVPPTIFSGLRDYLIKARQSANKIHRRVYSLLHCAFVSSDEWFLHFSNLEVDDTCEDDLKSLLVELERRGGEDHQHVQEVVTRKPKRSREDGGHDDGQVPVVEELERHTTLDWISPSPLKQRAESQMVKFRHDPSVDVHPSFCTASPKPVNEVCHELPYEAPARTIIQVSTSAKREASDLAQSIHQLGGQLDFSAKYNEHAQLLLVAHGTIDSTEKYLSFAAARKHIVSPRYVIDSCRQGNWIDLRVNKHFAYEQNPYLNSRCAQLPIMPPFENWHVVLFCEAGTKMDDLTKVLQRGGCASLTCFPIAKKKNVASATINKEQLEGVSHVIVDGMFCEKRNAYLPPNGFPLDILTGPLATRVFTLPLVHYVLCGGEPALFDAQGALQPEKRVPANCLLANPFGVD